MPRSSTQSLLAPEQLARDLAVRDLTDSASGAHAIQLLVDDAVASLQRRWGAPVLRRPGPRVVTVADNYDNLLVSQEAVTRDSRYTRYVAKGQMLRSHSTAMVPAALRHLGGRLAPADVLVACAGIVYRRDAIDRLHTGMPHQLDLWRVCVQEMAAADLEEMIAVLVGALAPGRRYRCEPRVHPYTVHGRQVDVDRNGEWVEIAECGVAHPAVLARAGLDGMHGLALGMGLDRLLMLRKGIPDIRLLRSDDGRVARQMADLEPYRPVSILPAVRRDISVAVDAAVTAEDLGDRVRCALGPAESEAVEEVAVIGQASYGELPVAARERLGLSPAQKNLLVRIVLRPLDRTLTDEHANDLRDRIYGAIHQGSGREWAARADGA
jgi:phenylalanyl-tRNA synthetase alpha chain